VAGNFRAALIPIERREDPLHASWITEERQLGYAWETDFGITNAVAFYEAVRTAHRDEFLDCRSRGQYDRKPEQWEVAEILASQDPSNGWTDLATFVTNMEV
jgi:hypothetical protein